MDLLCQRDKSLSYTVVCRASNVRTKHCYHSYHSISNNLEFLFSQFSTGGDIVGIISTQDVMRL